MRRQLLYIFKYDHRRFFAFQYFNYLKKQSAAYIIKTLPVANDTKRLARETGA